MTLFALVVVGYIAGKLGYLGGDFDRQLSRLVINITCPALILSSAMNGTLPDRRYILPLLGISVITYLILTGAALFLPRYMTTKQEDEGAVGFAMMFGNVGFMGYPSTPSLSLQLAPYSSQEKAMWKVSIFRKRYSTPLQCSPPISRCLSWLSR